MNNEVLTEVKYTKVDIGDAFFAEICEVDGGFDIWLGREYYAFKMIMWGEGKRAFKTGKSQTMRDIVKKVIESEERVDNFIADYRNAINSIPEKQR